MEFLEFRDMLAKNFTQITQEATHLFEVDVDKDDMWNIYLDSFPAGTNEMFRERREYDCSCCRHFIKTIGNAVVLKDNQVRTIWDFQTGDSTYQPVIDALDVYVKSHTISGVYISKNVRIGTDHNFEQRQSGEVARYDHFCLDMPRKFVYRSSRSEGDIKGEYRDTRNVFKRSLEEISEDSITTILELISQNSLYKGEEWKGVLIDFLKYKQQFDGLSDAAAKENYTWEQSVKVGPVIGRIRNHSIGTLLVHLSEGMDLDTAVKKYEDIVAGPNYKRPKPIFTQRMLEDAKKTIKELGYMDSLPRRYAILDDITVNNILFANRDSAKRIGGGDIFAEMSKGIAINPKKFSKVEEIDIEKFISDVLPGARELEVLFENQHVNNMVSLIAPENPECKTMFKWNNGFGWAYTGNITDSNIRENVKSAGGRVDGVLRFSIQWNDMDYDRNDLDAHCQEPGGEHIYFNSSARRPGRSRMGGQLDVDITQPIQGTPAVENITWPDKSKMKPGVYKFWVHNYTNRGGRKGFRAEIEFDGKIYSFDYPNEVKKEVAVAEVTLDSKGNFSIKELLPSNESSRQVWGLHTNQFVPVSVVMYSPNYWDYQNGIGHRHYFFMLKECVNPERPNGFFNEYLKQELMQYKRVFEALGGRMAVKDVEDQLSGLGFSATKRNELVVKVKGQVERILKIKF